MNRMMQPNIFYQPTVLLRHDTAASFIDGLLQSTHNPQQPQTTLIVASSRESFLSRLQQCTSHEALDQASFMTKSPQPLSLALLAKSRDISFAFCPSIAHIRAYLSVFHPKFSAAASTSEQRDSKPEQQPSVLAILDVLSLHRSSSAQGLAQTLALAVETALRTQMRLVLCDCQDTSMGAGYGSSGAEPWDAQLPLLSPNTRLPADQMDLKELKVGVIKVAERWFQFRDGLGQA